MMQGGRGEQEKGYDDFGDFGNELDEEDAEHCCLVMERCRGPELHEYIQSDSYPEEASSSSAGTPLAMRERLARTLFVQMVDGVA